MFRQTFSRVSSGGMNVDFGVENELRSIYATTRITRSISYGNGIPPFRGVWAGMRAKDEEVQRYWGPAWAHHGWNRMDGGSVQFAVVLVCHLDPASFFCCFQDSPESCMQRNLQHPRTHGQ